MPSDEQQSRPESPTGRLFHRAARGEPDAFRNIVERYQGRLYAVAFSVLRNADEARDVVQDVFVKLHRSMSSIKKPSHLGAWLLRVARHLAIDRMRAARRRRVAISYSQFVDPADVEQLFHLLPRRAGKDVAADTVQAVAEKIFEAIEKLPDYYRESFLLRYMEEMSVREIAQFLRVPETTVEGRIFKARQIVREYLRGME